MEVVKSIEADEAAAAAAHLEMWGYALAFAPMAVLKCAIELQIADVLENHGGAMTHAELSAAISCSPSILHRIMRYLVHRRIFKKELMGQDSSSSRYIQTPISKLLLMKDKDKNMAALVLLESSPVMLAPWHRLSSRALKNEASAFGATHGKDLWDYGSANLDHCKLINDAMACRARPDMRAIVGHYPEAFKGIGSVVDVGGGDGTAMRILVEACPWVLGINFDLPHVVAMAPLCDGVEHVGGNMFEIVPKADAAFLMSVLHDWSDDECISILKKCREAIRKDKGKVIIAEAVICEGEDSKYANVRFALDMVMLAHTETGKERTMEEWEYVVKAAGFARSTVKHIECIASVIEAYP